MKNGALLAVTVTVFCVAWFGRACFGGYVVADYSEVMDTYHLSTICERFGHHLRNGRLALWLPEFGGGYPGHALWMYGFLSPQALLWAVLPSDNAYAWSVILHIMFGSVGMFAFLRERDCVPAAAMTGALIFGLSEYTLGRGAVGHVNQLWALAWAPWVLRAITRCVRGAPGSTGRLAIWSGVALISGHVQLWFWLGPLMVAYAVLEWRAAGMPRAALARVSAGAGLALAIAAVQWMPTAELMSVAERPEPEAQLFEQWSAPPQVLASKVAPGMLGRRPDSYWGGEPFEHEHTGVGGLCVLFLVLLGAWPKKRGRFFWASVGVFGLVLSLGAHWAPSETLNRLPLIGWGRVPGRAQILTLLAAAVLAGQGVSDWLESREGSWKELRGPLLVTAVIGTAATIWLYVWSGSLTWPRATDLGDVTRSDVWQRVAGPALLLSLLGAGVVVTALIVCRRKARLVLLVPGAMLVALSLGSLHPVDSVESDFLHFDWAANLPPEVKEHRVHLADLRMPYVERGGLRTFRRLAHVNTRWQAELEEHMSPEVAAWMDTGATIVRDVRDQRGPPVELLQPGFVVLQPPPVPPIGRARLFREHGDGESRERVLQRMVSGRRALWLNRGYPDLGIDYVNPDPSDASTVEGVRIVPTANPHEIVYEVDTPHDAWLFESERYYPGWEAELDGESVPVEQANIAFRAVPVPAGKHRVVMSYRPGSVRIGALLSLLALVAAAWLGRPRRAPHIH